MGRETGYTLDVELQLKDAGALTATDICQVGGADAIIDQGDGDALMMGDLVLDVSAIDVADGNELYTIILEGSDNEDFSAGIHPLAMIQLGDQSVILGGADVDSTIGRYVVPFRTERNGIRLQYLRLHAVISGTTPSINFTAFLCRHKGL